MTDETITIPISEALAAEFKRKYNRGFDEGVGACIQHLYSMAAECCGGDGRGEAAGTYRAAAGTLERLQKNPLGILRT